MVKRPFHVLSPLDFTDPVQCAIWTAQVRSEMKELVALSKATIDETKTLMAEADRLLVRR